MLKAYETRRGELQRALESSRDVKETIDCAVLFLDRILQDTLAQAESREERAQIERLFAAARQALACMQAVSQAYIRMERRVPPPLSAKEKLRSCLPMVSGALSALLCVWMILAGQRGAAALCVPLVIFAFVPRGARISEQEEQAQAVPQVDAHELLRLFDRLMDKLDALMTDLRSSQPQTTVSGAPLRVTDRLLEPVQMLMEASLTQDGCYALKALPQIREALREQGVQALDYSEENRAYFELFPSEQGGRTIRPALIREGQLILRGQATEMIG